MIVRKVSLPLYSLSTELSENVQVCKGRKTKQLAPAPDYFLKLCFVLSENEPFTQIDAAYFLVMYTFCIWKKYSLILIRVIKFWKHKSMMKTIRQGVVGLNFIYNGNSEADLSNPKVCKPQIVFTSNLMTKGVLPCFSRK